MIAEHEGFAMYLNQQVQSHQVFDFMLDKMGGADSMTISSFAITEAYIRRIIRNRHRIKQVDLILDFTIASRNTTIMLYAAKNVDRVYLVNNHSKIIYLRKDEKEAVAIMSNNATNNHRYEAGLITSHPGIVESFRIEIEKLKQNAKLY